MARRNRHDEVPEVVLPITPMLDMAFQLLAFFIFTYHPSDLEGQIEMHLPDKPEAADTAPPPVPTPSDTDDAPKLDSDVTVILRTQHDGQLHGDISQIMVRVLSDPDKPIDSPEELLKYLTRLRDDLTNREGIKIQGDSQLKWGKVVQIMDICRRAGFKNVGLGPPPDLNFAP
jgi:biopolymer transport protein ExbD